MTKKWTPLSQLIDEATEVWGQPGGWPAVDALVEVTGHTRVELCELVAAHPLFDVDLRNAVAAVAIRGPKTGPLPETYRTEEAS